MLRQMQQLEADERLAMMLQREEEENARLPYREGEGSQPRRDHEVPSHSYPFFDPQQPSGIGSAAQHGHFQEQHRHLPHQLDDPMAVLLQVLSRIQDNRSPVLIDTANGRPSQAMLQMRRPLLSGLNAGALEGRPGEQRQVRSGKSRANLFPG